MKLKLKVLIISPFIFILKAHAEEVQMSLDEAVAVGLRDNTDILLKKEDVAKAKAKITEAKAALLPSLTAVGTWSNTHGYYNKDVNQTGVELTLSQMIYNGGKTINTIKYNQYGVTIAETILDKEKLELIYGIKKAYYTLMLSVEFAELNKGIMENTAAHLDSLLERYKNGEASQSDILRVKSSLSSVTKVYEMSMNQVEAVRAEINNLLHLEKEVALRPSGKFTYEPLEIAYDEAFLRAFKRRPEIKQYEMQEKAAVSAVEIAKAGGRPTISASWDYYSNSHLAGSTGMTKNWNDYGIVGFVLSWPIFDGFATKAKVEQAVVDLKQAKLMRDKASNDIALDVKRAYLGLRDALAKIRSAQSEIELYEDRVSVVQGQYKAGIASVLDLNDTSLAYKISLFNQNEATYDYIIFKANFERATGGPQ